MVGMEEVAADVIELRDYQERMYLEARELRAKGARSMIFQLPTGGGKTLIASKILRTCADKGFTGWFLVHRREILRQSLLKLTDAGVPAGIVASGMAANKLAPIQVCSVQTLARRHFNLPRPQLIVHDECHHLASAVWASIHAAYPDACHIGLSATPQRLDGQGLGRFFEHMIIGPSAQDLINDKWLAPYRMFAPVRPDLSGVETVAGDYNKKQLAVCMNRSSVAGDTIANYRKYVPGRRAIVFMWSVESSIEMAQRFNQQGIPAAHIDGGTDDRTRDRAIQQFRDGQILVLTNVDIVGEGFDTPSAHAGFFCRPTQSLTLWLQQCGRILRWEQDKTAFFFDQASNSMRLGLPCEDREWSLDTTKTRRKKKDNDDAVRVCPKCTETWGMHVRVCRCGYVLINAREMDIDEAADLSEVDAQQIRRRRLHEQGRAQSLESLIALGKSRGYRNPLVWAKFVIKAREEKAARRAEKAALQRQTEPVTQSQEEAWLF
jgi:DNA repair protein RadD